VTEKKLNFDYTYITLFGCIIFEPLVIVTNVIFFTLCFIFFKILYRYPGLFAKQMAVFLILLGTSSLFGALAHSVHYQLGTVFFDAIFFIMNALSLLAIYYCFKAHYTFHHLGRQPSKMYVWLAFAWVMALLVYSLLESSFKIVKAHAALVLVYSLIVHYLSYRTSNENGSRLIIIGILVSFLSILVHSLHFSFHEWFNYKDEAHIVMIVSLIMIYRGTKQLLDSANYQATIINTEWKE
jgi:ABC-type enterobactin transport system permease subunit